MYSKHMCVAVQANRKGVCGEGQGEQTPHENVLTTTSAGDAKRQLTAPDLLQLSPCSLPHHHSCAESEAKITGSQLHVPTTVHRDQCCCLLLLCVCVCVCLNAHSTRQITRFCLCDP